MAGSLRNRDVLTSDTVCINVLSSLFLYRGIVWVLMHYWGVAANWTDSGVCQICIEARQVYYASHYRVVPYSEILLTLPSRAIFQLEALFQSDPEKCVYPFLSMIKIKPPTTCIVPCFPKQHSYRKGCMLVLCHAYSNCTDSTTWCFISDLTVGSSQQ